MKHLTRTIDRWPRPVAFAYDRLCWIGGKLFRKSHGYPAHDDVKIIASPAHANALLRKALKQLLRHRRVAIQTQNTIIWEEWRLVDSLRVILDIQPGAAYHYHDIHLGTRKVSRIIPSDVLVSPARLTALNFQMRAEAKGSMVTMEQRLGKTIATYEKQVYVKALRIIPKACVEKSKCSNG